jgi:hypothetical protein
MRYLQPALSSRPAHRKLRPSVETLEARVVPSASGHEWPRPERVTFSFMPDGTLLGTNAGGNVYSNLFAKFNAKWPTATWQNLVVKAAQTWAAATNINFDLVSDSGAPTGSGSYQQGDTQFGDIRIGGYIFGNSYLATAFLPPSVNNYSIAGDINFNTGINFNINTTYDLFSVALHEFGHAIGVDHSTFSTSAVFPTYNGVKFGLGGDDVTVVRSIYDGARRLDAYDQVAANGSFAAASNIDALINSTTKAGVHNNLDISATSDVDFYRVTVPAATTGTLKLTVQTAGLSLLRQAVTVYASNQSTVLGSGSSAGANDGTVRTITVNGVTAGQVLYVRVAGADTTAFGTGRYAMMLNFGSGADPAVLLPNTQVANGTPLQGGGSQTNPTPQLNLYNILPGYSAFASRRGKHSQHRQGRAPRRPALPRSTPVLNVQPQQTPGTPSRLLTISWDAAVAGMLSDPAHVHGLTSGKKPR